MIVVANGLAAISNKIDATALEDCTHDAAGIGWPSPIYVASLFVVLSGVVLWVFF
jgi:hypothetical protein